MALSNWLNINRGNMSGRYIKELIDFEYIKKVETSKTYSWDSNVKSNTMNLKILVPIENKGDYVLVKNNIENLYNEIFEKAKL